MPEEFPSNSKSGRDKKVVAKVISGSAIKRKTPIGRKIKEIFLGGDARTALLGAATEVLVPAFKNMLVDGGRTILERVVYGEAQFRRGSRPSEYGRPRVTYNSSSSLMRNYGRPGMLPDQPPVLPRGALQMDEVILPTREECQAVLIAMHDMIDGHEVVSVGDLRAMIGWPSSHIDEKWGWTDLSRADVRQIREGYLLDLPPVESI